IVPQPWCQAHWLTSSRTVAMGFICAAILATAGSAALISHALSEGYVLAQKTWGAEAKGVLRLTSRAAIGGNGPHNGPMISGQPCAYRVCVSLPRLQPRS